MPEMLAFNPATSASPSETRYRPAERPTSTRIPTTSGNNLRQQFTRNNEAKLKGPVSRVIQKAAPDFDELQLTRANRAVEEAISVMSVVEFEEMPRMDVSDEGVFMLRWQRGHIGIALFFSGEGGFSFSSKSGPNDHYTSDYTERRVEEGVTENLRSTILALSKTNDDPIAGAK